MKLIVGLGNPGKEYENTRHNLGFLIIEKLRNPLRVTRYATRFKAEVGEGEWKGGKILLVKPQTFMNLSGEAVAKIKNFYKLENSDIWVINDEVDLKFGKIRVRQGGKSAGHRGVQSIIDKIGESFWRIRVGINFDRGIEDTDDYVMGQWSKEERSRLPKLIDKVEDLVLQFLKQGIFEVTKNGEEN